MHYVFVYGTLKKGYAANMYLEDGVFVGQGTTIDTFKMADNSVYPMIVPSTNDLVSGHVVGEVYKVDDDIFNMLDDYEGYPSLYDRDQYSIELFDGTVVDCWIYTYNRKLVHSELIYPCHNLIEW